MAIELISKIQKEKEKRREKKTKQIDPLVGNLNNFPLARPPAF